MEFKLTRDLISRLDGWLARLAAPILPPRRVYEGDQDFHWEFTDPHPQALQVGKAVRMISGIRGALLLADAGYTVECNSLLRMVSDFAQEVIAVGEGLLEGRLTEPQLRFVRQYFAPFARTPEELEQRERERYVSREELLRAQYRLAAKTVGEAERLQSLRRFLNYGYDKYVHGAYLTAMELYDEDGNYFMLKGHKSPKHRYAAMTCVAGKLHEVMVALHMMALAAREETLIVEILEEINQLDHSGEYSGKGYRDFE